MSDYICPYRCSYRTNSGYCGYTGGHDACQYKKVVGFDYDKKEFVYAPAGSYAEAYGLVRKPATNYDKLHAMNDVELAEFISGKARTFGEEYEGYMSALDWLREEAVSDG